MIKSKKAIDHVAVIVFICVFALDAMPVLQLAVLQHLYDIPAHTPLLQAYVFVGHVDCELHEYKVPVTDPAAYVEAV
jgi:hypothetical protein